MAVEIIGDNCTGCRLCLRACPYGAIEMVDTVAAFTDACVQCGACVSACKFGAIVVRSAYTRDIDPESLSTADVVLSKPVSLKTFQSILRFTGEIAERRKSIRDLGES